MGSLLPVEAPMAVYVHRQWPVSPKSLLLLHLLLSLHLQASYGAGWPSIGRRQRGGDDPDLSDVYANMNPVQYTGPQDWVIHDPSKIVATDGLLMIAVTGKAQEDGYTCGLETWYISADQTDWQPGQCLFTSKPEWVAAELPANDGAYWAPTLVDGRKMYYSVSAFGDDDAQCIGLATATGVAPHLTWQDAGKPVTCSFDPESNGDTNAPNGIDPAFFQDQDGSQHLIFGGGRIWMTEIDPQTGFQIEDNWWEWDDPSYHFLAKGPGEFDNPDESAWIEAAYMHQHQDWYFLFVNWFGCCMGIDSTYEIHVGRSASRSGPYLDKEGVEMTNGGGSLVLKKEGRFIGPGHAAIFQENGREWFSFHFYDGEREDGIPWVETRLLNYDSEGWPVVTEERFNATAYFNQS